MIIKNARVYKSSFHFEQGEVYIEDSLIKKSTSDNEVLDADGLMVVPGFIDIHLHGANKADFMDGCYESLDAITSYEASKGITSISPASMTMDKSALEKAFISAKDFNSKKHNASIEGIYMEGPFISKDKIGAQNPKYLKNPDVEFFDDLYQASGSLIKVVVLAPEVSGGIDFIKAVKDRVKVSIGHTNTDYETAKNAFIQGASELTHTFNAMPPINHRNPGPIVAALDNGKVMAELIADGIHIDKAIINLAFRLFTKDNLVLISDSMMATGLDDGIYALGGQKVNVKGKRATLDDGTLAGSVTNLYDCFVNVVKNAGIKIEDAVKACTYNPACVLNIVNKVGSIESGKRADLLLIDDDLNLKGVILRGEVLFFNR